MEGKDWRYFVTDRRAQVYLLWAVLVTFGFVVTHFFQYKLVNGLWTVLALIGLGFMYKVMPLRDKRMRQIYMAWLVPIVAGMFVSGLVFYWHSLLSNHIIMYLGAFWLVIMSIGYFWNGLVDAPSQWYWVAAGLNLAAAIACVAVPQLTPLQYILAAIVSAWSLTNLWLFRSPHF